MTVNFLRRIVDSITFRRDCEKSVETLSRMDDRTLRDIGVDRCDIRQIVETQLLEQRRIRQAADEHRIKDLRAECGI